MTIDPSKLPRRALFDSGVVMRALGDFAADPNSKTCQDIFTTMLANGAEVLISAPTVAEVMRKDATKTIPRTPFVEIVAFDLKAAELLGSKLPIAVLKEHRDKHGTTLTILKYDALIVACAARYSAECIVTLDEDIEKLAPHVGLVGYHPRHFLTPTTILTPATTIAMPAVAPFHSVITAATTLPSPSSDPSDTEAKDE